MRLSLTKHISLIVRLRSGGEDRYRLEMDRPSGEQARLAFRMRSLAGVWTRLDWSTDKANTTAMMEGKASYRTASGGRLPSWICGPRR
jgi:hypothetical protein